MSNPFEAILERLDVLEANLSKANPSIRSNPEEIIDRKELCRRLNITEPTAIRLGRSGRLVSFRIGNSVRYNWQAVIQKLEETKKR